MQNFPTIFEAITGVPPFPWQGALYQRFIAGELPQTEKATIPTGLGKTSIITIWLCALVARPDVMPRRLVYVVNRRTVVDQTTTEAEELCKALNKPELSTVRDMLASLCALPLPGSDASPLAISTLRGKFADNGAWCVDPSRPAVVIGTVDMIGSGLLFSRYTRGFKTRPLHAGFLGQDALFVHDEAHLEPAFQKLIESVVTAQRCSADPRKLRLIELTATSRAADTIAAPPFTLTEADLGNEIVKMRFNAVKRLSLAALGEKDKLEAKIIELAEKATVNRAILIFTRSVETAVKVAAALDKGERKGKVATLTGTMRGKERDELVAGPKDKDDPSCYSASVFQRFLHTNNRSEALTPVTGTVFLVATSAGEVGVNLSADDLICDLSTYESMAQRFGRVNRFGIRDDSKITVFHEKKFDRTKPLETARERTIALLKKLDGSASPAALDRLPSLERAAAFSPEPDQRVATEIQFDAWALTSIREPIAARPPVAPYLHGEAEWQPPETHLAWRSDLDFQHFDDPEAFLDEFPLKPSELLRDTTARVVKTLAALLSKRPSTAQELPDAWLLAENGSVTAFKLTDFNSEAAGARLADSILLLPCSLGGLVNGLLQADADSPVSDVSEIIRQVSDNDTEIPAGHRLVRAIELSEEDAEEPRILLYLKAIPHTAAACVAQAETLAAHTSAVIANTAALAAKFFPDKSALPEGEPDLRCCVIAAARMHDLGKNRAQWQRNLGNSGYDPTKPETILAKSSPGMLGRNVAEHYRHEFGSISDAYASSELNDLTETERDIVLHLVAAHHGRARPNFPIDEVFDYSGDCSNPEQGFLLAAEIPRRFARLQKRFGRWGLAWLESILRAADYAASTGIVASSEADANPANKRELNCGKSMSSQSCGEAVIPSITLAVDPTNPGHYFACCGLLELASRLDPFAFGWFAEDGFGFNLAVSATSVDQLLNDFISSEIRILDPKDAYTSPILIGNPFQIRLDWWKTTTFATASLKTWTGQMKCSSICNGLLNAIREATRDPSFSPSSLLFDSRVAYISDGSSSRKVEPFYFDANRGPNAHSRDVGFAPNDLGLETMAAPASELLCLIGLQRATPSNTKKARHFEYHLWHNPIPASILITATNGLLPDSRKHRFHFESWFRDGQRKNKAFLSAKAVKTAEA